MLEFDFNLCQWVWDIEKIQTLGITDCGIVELVARNIQKLSIATQHVLKLAACMGYQFSLDNLATVSGKSLIDTANALWETLQSSLILPLSQADKIPLFADELESEFLQVEHAKIGYKFLHDRVQQAAYSLVPDEQKQETHLQIGRLLLEKTPLPEIEENIFDIANQLNIGTDLITAPVEREQLASLNLIASSPQLIQTT